MGSHDLVIRSLEEEMHNFDIVVDTTGSVKDSIAEITTRAFVGVNLDDVRISDPKSVAAFATLANTALKAVESKENTAKNRVVAKLKLQESKRSDGAAEIVAQMYRQMQDGTYSPDAVTETPLTSDEAALAERFAHDKIEDIPDWELRTDPNDLSE